MLLRARTRLSFCSVIMLLAILFASAEARANEGLTNQQIRAALSGNTITITTRNLEPAMGFFTAGGSVRGVIGDAPFTGTWTARDNLLCLDFPDEDYDFCRRLVRADDAFLFFTANGSPAGKATVRRGNPNSF